MLKKFVKDTEFAPTIEAFENRIPFAVLFRQEAPLRTASSDPKHGVEKTAAIATRTEADFGTGF